MRYFVCFVFNFLLLVFSSNAQKLNSVSYSQVYVEGELAARLNRNYNRLEDDIYRPENVFNAGGASEGWPGDKEGRTILGLALQAQANHRAARYLETIIDQLPGHLNEKGYLGPVYKDSVLEQQLSGHGWLLRGLCTYYEWKKDKRVKSIIQGIVHNLALPTTGFHREYPIDPSSREKGMGAAAGTTLNTVGRWKLSTDIGCDFIFLDGLVHAYQLFPEKKLRTLIEEMTERFFQIQLEAINAQTHATLTALRAILRFYTITGDRRYLTEVEKRYLIYRNAATSSNYENFNWFGRPSWSEPCAIVDSYIVAVQLWQFLNNPLYLEDAHNIYYNALSRTQRANGGFGLDNCTHQDEPFLKVVADEAYWCCTMRGAEGLTSAVRFSCFSDQNRVIFPFFFRAVYNLGDGLRLQTITRYPFSSDFTVKVLQSGRKKASTFSFFAPRWMNHFQISLNGKPIPFELAGGFVNCKTALKAGDILSFNAQTLTSIQKIVNTKYNKPELYTLNYGVLQLGTERERLLQLSSQLQLVQLSDSLWSIRPTNIILRPVYHLLDTTVNKQSGKAMQVLFEIPK
ncbi:glycoside hydrolase family protein [Niabella aquatica]